MSARLALACGLSLLVGCRAVFGMLDPTTAEDTVDASGDDGAPPDDGPPVDTSSIIDTAPPIDAPIVTTSHAANGDTFLASDGPGTNFSTQDSALADGDTVRTALFRFDLGAIPTTATVTAAELLIFTDFDPGGPCSFFEVLESWDEATTTFNSRSNGTSWTNAGAGPPTSRSNTVIGTANPNTANTVNVVTIDPAVVAGWVANPATNNGFAIVTVDADGTRFTTKEGTANQRPSLRVTHSP